MYASGNESKNRINLLKFSWEENPVALKACIHSELPPGTGKKIGLMHAHCQVLSIGYQHFHFTMDLGNFRSPLGLSLTWPLD